MSGIPADTIHSLAGSLQSVPKESIKKLGRRLGFQKAEVDRYLAGKISYHFAIQQILTEWSDIAPPETQWVEMRSALHEAGLAHLARKHVNENLEKEQLGGPYVEQLERVRDQLERELEREQLEQLGEQLERELERILRGTPIEILAQGAEGRQAYEEALKEGKQTVFRTRVMLVGQERVGKTSLKHSLTGGKFNEREVSTQGIDTKNVCELNIHAVKPGSVEGTWLISDELGGDYESKIAAVIKQKLEKTQERSTLGMDPRVHYSLGEEKHKLEKGDTSKEFRSEAMAESHGKLREIPETIKDRIDEQTRAISDSEIFTIWDFAGQDIYYTSHQVFLTWRAIYLLVFNLSDDLDKAVPLECQDDVYRHATGGSHSDQTRLDVINFWLSSIYAHAAQPESESERSEGNIESSTKTGVRNVSTKKSSAAASLMDVSGIKSPPIILVGTHRESLSGSESDKQKQLLDIKDKIFRSFRAKKYRSHILPTMFAVENSKDNDEEVTLLCREVENLAMKERYWGEEIPIRWLQFEELASNIAQEKLPYKPLEEVKEMTRSIGIDEDFLPMLNFYHDQGTIIYFGAMTKSPSLLQDIVIFDPQWLIDIFKLVIGISDSEIIQMSKDPLSQSWYKLENEGILEHRLAKHIWTSFCSQEKSVESFVNFFLNLMERFDLISEASATLPSTTTVLGPASHVSEDASYYVPSKFTPKCTPTELNIVEALTARTFYVDFHGFLPAGLFHRYMCRVSRLLEGTHGRPVRLFYRQMIIPFSGRHRVLIEMMPPTDAEIRITVYLTDETGISSESPVRRQTDPTVVDEVLVFFRQTFQDLCKEWAKRIEFTIAKRDSTHEIGSAHRKVNEAVVLLQEALDDLCERCSDKLKYGAAGGLLESVRPSGPSGLLQNRRGHDTQMHRTQYLDGEIRGSTTCIKEIGMEGGVLAVDSCGVSMEIPPNAIKTKSTVIGISVIQNITGFVPFRADEMFASFGVECTPEGLDLAAPVTITIPHCAMLPRPSRVTAVLYSGIRENGTLDRSVLPNSSGASCEVQAHDIRLHITHFSFNIVAFFRNALASEMRVQCHPLMPVELPENRRPLCHLYVYKDLEGVLENVEKETGGFHTPTPRKVFLLRTNGKRLHLTCTVEGQETEETDLRYNAITKGIKDYETFVVDASSHREKMVTLVVQQEGRRDEDAARLKFQTKFKDVRPVRGSRHSVSEPTILDISKEIPVNKYHSLGVKLGLTWDKAENVLVKHGNDVEKAATQLLIEWRNAHCKESEQMDDLRKILESSGLGRLAKSL